MFLVNFVWWLGRSFCFACRGKKIPVKSMPRRSK